MAAGNRKPDRLFYAGWIALTAVSFPIAWTIGAAFLSRVVDIVGGTIQIGGQTHITEDFLFGFFIIPLLGALTGFLQYLLLRRYLPGMAWWIAATVASWLLLFAILRIIALAASAALDLRSIWVRAFMLLLIGGSFGLPEWMLLRRRVRGAAWWIVANLLGWGAALLVAGETISSLPDVLAVVLLPPVAGCIAWWLMLDKLQQRASSGSPRPFASIGAH